MYKELIETDFTFLQRPYTITTKAGFPSKLVESLFFRVPSVLNLTSDMDKYEIDKYKDRNDRLSYAYQLIIGRKFSDRFSFQIAPTLVHFNLVEKIAYPKSHQILYQLLTENSF